MGLKGNKKHEHEHRLSSRSNKKPVDLGRFLRTWIIMARELVEKNFYNSHNWLTKWPSDTFVDFKLGFTQVNQV